MSHDGRARVFFSSILALLLLATASVLGIILDDGGDPYRVTSLRGQAVDLYGGQGLYRSDSVAKAVTFRGFDWANVVVCLPLSILGLLLYRRGRLRGQIILAALFTYIAYNYLIGVMGNAFNALFLVWTALFATGAFGVALAVAGIDAPSLPGRLATGFPRKSLAVYMLLLGVVLLFQNLEQVLTAYAAGRPPAALEHYTTLELAALELGIMVPLHIVGGALLWRRRAWGYLIAIPLAFTAAMTFIALSVGQVLLYLSFGGHNIAGVVQMVGLATIASALSFVTFQRVRG
jgi:uncharacterized membrane protein YfhO